MQLAFHSGGRKAHNNNKQTCYDETLVFSTFFCFFKVCELRYRFSDMPGSPVSKTGGEKIGWLLLKLRTGGDVYPG